MLNADNSTPRTGLPVFIDAADSTQQITKPELAALVRKLGKGLTELAGLQESDVVLVCSENSVRFLSHGKKTGS